MSSATTRQWCAPAAVARAGWPFGDFSLANAFAVSGVTRSPSDGGMPAVRMVMNSAALFAGSVKLPVMYRAAQAR